MAIAIVLADSRDQEISLKKRQIEQKHQDKGHRTSGKHRIDDHPKRWRSVGSDTENNFFFRFLFWFRLGKQQFSIILHINNSSLLRDRRSTSHIFSSCPLCIGTLYIGTLYIVYKADAIKKVQVTEWRKLFDYAVFNRLLLNPMASSNVR